MELEAHKKCDDVDLQHADVYLRGLRVRQTMCGKPAPLCLVNGTCGTRQTGVKGSSGTIRKLSEALGEPGSSSGLHGQTQHVAPKRLSV